MKRVHSTQRRIINRIVFAILVLFVGATLVSGCLDVSWRSADGRRCLLFCNGNLHLTQIERTGPERPTRPMPPIGFYFSTHSVRAWQLSFERPDWGSNSTETYREPEFTQYKFDYVLIPTWLPISAIALVTAFLWWTGRRFPTGYCQNCGYSLYGLTGDVCPECGQPLVKSNPGT